MSLRTAYISGSTGGGSGGEFIAPNTGVLLYYRTDLSTGAATITFGGTSFGVEVINDSGSNNIAIRFDGTAAAIPTSGTSMVNNNLIRPKEARYFPVEATTASVIASAASTELRVTVFIQAP